MPTLCHCPCCTQFSQNEDFDKYPRDHEADVAQLTAVGVDAVFEPVSLYTRSGS
jgi:pantothenate synthetase